jgi:hypothetical protein
MTHPTAAELLDLHFTEAAPARATRLAAHVAGCAACGALLADLEWVERSLAGWPDGAPPADGLARVLERIESLQAPVARRRRAPGAVLPSAAAILAGAAAVVFGGAQAALAFLATGSLVTLSLAPALILESQRRGREAAAR